MCGVNVVSTRASLLLAWKLVTHWADEHLPWHPSL
eukprot:COSAG06_NODE_3029_length_5943_cov_1.732204_1_plen_34_part_10